MLNYGHTFAHAFETAAGYGAWLHGEAVSAGMVYAAQLAERLGLLRGDLIPRQARAVQRFGLPTVMPEPWPAGELIAVMKRDKKAAGGKTAVYLPTRIGQVKLVDDVPESLAADALEGR